LSSSDLPTSLDNLADYPELSDLLEEIGSNLRTYFGTDSTPRLEVSNFGDEGPYLKAIMQWSGPISAANAALAKFDNGYWLANCDRAAGRIIVDYQLV